MPPEQSRSGINATELAPATEAAAYEIADRLLSEGSIDPQPHAWHKIGQMSLRAGKRLRFWDNVSNSELAGSILDHDKDTNIASVLLEGQEEPSEIHSSLLRGAGNYVIKHKKGHAIATATVSIAIGSLYIWAKKKTND